MTVIYATLAKTARMNALVTLLNGGTLELLGTANAVLAPFTLNNPSGTVVNGVLTLSGFPKNATAVGGLIQGARLRSSAGADVVTGLSVGLAGSGADIIVSSLSGSPLTPFTGDAITVSGSPAPTLTHA